MKATVNLYVYAVFPSGQLVQVGRLLSRNLNSYEQYEGFFKYSPDYLQHPLAYAIDPIHLPLQGGTFHADNRSMGLHMVFDDSLPDGWGRHILARKGGLERQRFAPAHLLSVLQGGGLGRFLFSEKEIPLQCATGSIAFADIAKAIDEAGKLEDAIDTSTAELQHLLACGSSAGGARPKVLTSKDDMYWLAKFASRRDVHPQLLVSLEEAGMTLARLAGLDVPELDRVMVGERDVLLIKRFDVTVQNGRNGLISFRTLLGIEDHYSAHYADLAAVLRRYSSQAELDLELLFRQMVLNVLLINTDDHLQNFAMIHTDTGWKLSPAYDIVPNIYQTGQILQVNGKHGEISNRDLILEGKAFGLSSQRGKSLVADVLGRCGPWQDVFSDCNVPEAHTEKLRGDINHRFTLLAEG